MTQPVVIDVIVARAILGPDVKQDGYGTVYWDPNHNGRNVKVTLETLQRELR